MFSYAAEHHTLETLQNNPTWELLGQSLRSAVPESFDSPALRAAVLGLSLATVPGCLSPQTKSYWMGSFTALPAPPAEARMQLGTSSENDGTLFINYVVWNSSSNLFERKDIHYSTKNSLGLNNSTYAECGGYKQAIHDGEVLYGGAIVDQVNGKIILSNGNYIDGKTGSIFSEQGAIVKKLEVK